jgi:glycosyltransferase involved in cell wall biosynthesis
MQPISFCINTAKNELDYIKLLFKSLKDNLKSDEHEIVVFIDSDNEGTFEWLLQQKSQFKDLKILKNNLPVCYGYARNINEMFKFASHDIVSYIQSDMVISKDYDEYILKHVKPNTILSSTRIEPPLHGPGPEKHTMNFGLVPSEFKYEEFLEYCENNRQEKLTEYFFAPFTMHKDVWNSIGGHDTLFRRSREDSDILNRLILSGAEIVQTWEALVYHFTCTSSRGKGWFDKSNKEAQLRARLQEQADGVEMTRMFRKWGGFSHGKPFNYHYNIVANIEFDSANLMLLPIVETFFDKVGVTSEDAYGYLVNADEHKYANELLNFSQEDWNKYSYLYNTQNLEDRFVLGEVQGDVILTFKLSQINQENYNEVLQNLQHIIHNAEEGDWEVGGLILSIKNKTNNIKDKIKITNPEIKPEHLYKVY